MFVLLGTIKFDVYDWFESNLLEEPVIMFYQQFLPLIFFLASSQLTTSIHWRTIILSSLFSIFVIVCLWYFEWKWFCSVYRLFISVLPLEIQLSKWISNPINGLNPVIFNYKCLSKYRTWISTGIFHYLGVFVSSYLKNIHKTPKPEEIH